jgi:hypothetical protein
LEIASDDPVSRWVEHGVRGHVVRARLKQWLRFKTVDGRWVTAKFVVQRGYPGQHPLTHALVATELRFAEIAASTLERWRATQEAASTSR